MQNIKTIKNPYDNYKKELQAMGLKEESRNERGFFFFAKKIIQLSPIDPETIPASLIAENKTPKKITLLHVAAMCANEEAICLLLAKGADPHAQDDRGWTPAHHRLLLGEGGLQSKLIEVSNLDLQNDLHATALKVYELTTLQRNSDTICLWRPSSASSTQPMSPERYQEITKSVGIREQHVSCHYLYQSWLHPFTPPAGLYPFTPSIAKDYLQHRANPPAHVLSPVTHDEYGQMLPISLGLGVYSNGIFPAQRLVGEYMGRINTKIHSSEFWLIDGGNAQHKSSTVTRINCGFPNVAMMRIPAQEGFEGLSYRLAFVSLEEVDGQFCWNYGGHHHVKTGPYVELRPQALRDFVRSHDLIHLLTSLLADQGDHCKDWETYVKAEKTRYIIQTPSALFLLIMEGLIPATIANFMLTIAETGSLVRELEKFSHLGDVAVALHGLYQTIQESDHAFGQDFIQTFHHLSATLPFSTFLKTAEVALKKMKSGAPSKEEWELLKANLLGSKTRTELSKEVFNYLKTHGLPTVSNLKIPSIPTLTLEPSRISAPPHITEDELWADKILSEKFLKPGEQNYAVKTTFVAVKKRARKISGLQTAWDILELDSNENDIRKITVQYRKLCLKYHPDKNPKADPQKTVDITLAYKEILHDLNPEPINLDLSLSVEQNFQRANEHFQMIHESDLDTASKIDQFSSHAEEVKKLLEYANKENDELFKIMIVYHLQAVMNASSTHQLMRVLDAFDQLPADSSIEKKTAFYLNQQSRLLGLIDQYDLDNEKSTWSDAFLRDFLLINHRITDKYIAYSRSLAEIHAVNGSRSDLALLRKSLLASYANRKKNIQDASDLCSVVTQKYTSLLSFYSKPTQEVPEPAPSSEAPSSQMDSNQPQKEQAATTPETDTPSSAEMPPPVHVKKQRDAFEINTKKNMQFFTLKSKKGDE